jgi:hypothetical protein
MSEEKKVKVEKPEDQSDEQKSCFAVMPIADIDGYEKGHFSRVYEFIIKPACEKAGFNVKRADDTKVSNFIVLDILQQIYHSDIVICDLSARNPNVMYELGIRQAFELPTVLIKDTITPRIFDIQGLRDVAYDQSLRIDTVESAIIEVTNALTSTYEAHLKKDNKHINSIVSLLGITPAKVKESSISPELSVVLNELRSFSHRMDGLERLTIMANSSGHERTIGEMIDADQRIKSFQKNNSLGDMVLNILNVYKVPMNRNQIKEQLMRRNYERFTNTSLDRLLENFVTRGFIVASVDDEILHYRAA